MSLGGPTWGQPAAASFERTIALDLSYRPAAELLPVLTAHPLSGSVALSGAKNRIWLHGRAEALRPLVALVSEMDIPYREFWVSVVLDRFGWPDPSSRTRDASPPEAGLNTVRPRVRRWHTRQGNRFGIKVRIDLTQSP